MLVAQRDNLSWEARDSFNIVLMGMGEPLHNYDNVMKAIRILHDEHGIERVAVADYAFDCRSAPGR